MLSVNLILTHFFPQGHSAEPQNLRRFGAIASRLAEGVDNVLPLDDVGL